MFSPTMCQSRWNVPVEPVKWIPARAGCGTATRETAWPLPGTLLPAHVPEPRERAGRAGEVDTGEVGMRNRDPRDRLAVAGDHVDHAGRPARGFAQPPPEGSGELL